jgi:beta-barrel assembly-enhancing protease
VKSYLGEYVTPGAEPVETTVLIFDKELTIGCQDVQGLPVIRRWNILDVEAFFDRASHSTRLKNTRERDIEVFIKDNDAATVIKELQHEQQKPWHKKSRAKEWGRNLLLLFGILGALVLLYLLIVPWLAGKMASTVSVKTEERFGEAVYSALNLELQEDTAATRQVNEFFDAMGVRTAYDIRITVVNGDVVNAFALPGGRIVVYSALLKEMESYPELAALLSHEFTHVNNKHSTKSIFRRLGSKIFLGLLFGRIGNVTGVLADHADNLKSLKYSRGLEKEADLEGLALLQERKIDPKGFSDLFLHLKKSSSSTMPEFLGSHPDVDKRIDYIEKAAGHSTVEENTELKTIFTALKQHEK